MSVARTARRRRKQFLSNNAHLSGKGVPRPFGQLNKVKGRLANSRVPR